MQWFWVTSHLYGEQISIAVFAVSQGCCQPVLQSSTEQWVMQFAKSSAIVHWVWETSRLYGEQMSIGVFAVIKPAVSLFCRAALSSG